MTWSESTTALPQSAIAGEQSALAALLTESEPELRRRIGPRIPASLRGVVDSDDLLQEVYADAFRSIGRFEFRGAGSFERWLATIALRRLRREIRCARSAKRGGGWGRVRHVAGPDESAVTLLRLIELSDSTPSQQVARLEEGAALARMLDGLPEDCAAAVRLVYLEGCPLAEAARQLGKTEGAVHSLCYRAKLALRESLDRQTGATGGKGVSETGSAPLAPIGGRSQRYEKSLSAAATKRHSSSRASFGHRRWMKPRVFR